MLSPPRHGRSAAVRLLSTAVGGVPCKGDDGCSCTVNRITDIRSATLIELRRTARTFPDATTPAFAAPHNVFCWSGTKKSKTSGFTRERVWRQRVCTRPDERGRTSHSPVASRGMLRTWA